MTFLFLLTGCGETVRTSEFHETIFETNYTNSIKAISKQKDSCDSSYFDNFFLMTDLFLKGTLEQLSHDFSSILTGTEIRDPEVIYTSVYNEITEITEHNFRYIIRNFRKPKTITICPDEYIFPRQSIESAALNTSYYIHKTYRRLRQVDPDIKVTPITLNIAPQIIQSKITTNDDGRATKTSYFMSDNAYYSPLAASIVFLPHSESFKSHNDLNYWEVPLVPSHEYAHHLFQMIMGPSSKNAISTCFGHRHQETNTKNFGRRSVSIDDVINAYNEGFADLMAYYTLDKNERDVTGVKCLEKTRDIDSPFFFDGKKKIFSPSVLKTYFLRFEQFTLSCDMTNYQHPHTIGAIFAYSINQFFTELNLSDHQRIKVLIEWVNYLRQVKSRKISSEEWLKLTYSEIIRLAMNKAGRTFSEHECLKVNAAFPALNLPECQNL